MNILKQVCDCPSDCVPEQVQEAGSVEVLGSTNDLSRVPE